MNASHNLIAVRQCHFDESKERLTGLFRTTQAGLGEVREELHLCQAKIQGLQDSLEEKERLARANEGGLLEVREMLHESQSTFIEGLRAMIEDHEVLFAHQGASRANGLHAFRSN